MIEKIDKWYKLKHPGEIPLEPGYTHTLSKVRGYLSSNFYPITAIGVKELYIKTIGPWPGRELTSKEIHSLRLAMLLRMLNFRRKEIKDILNQFEQLEKGKIKDGEKTKTLEEIANYAAKIFIRLEMAKKNFSLLDEFIKKPLELEEKMELAKKSAYRKL